MSAEQGALCQFSQRSSHTSAADVVVHPEGPAMLPSPLQHDQEQSR